MASELGWVAVPGGRVVRDPARPGDPGRAVLRVVVVPRLAEQLPGTALENWPATVNGAAPLVEVRRTPDGEPEPVPATLRRTARSDAWHALTAHGLEVRPWQPPAGYEPPAVAETRNQAGLVHATYREAARKPGDDATVRAQLAAWPAGPRPEAPPLPDPVLEKVDLHRAVALLREHPRVLRLLGLVLELEIGAQDLPRSVGAAVPQVRVGWPGSPVPVSSPWTAYEYDGTHFLPAPAGDVRRGVVDLSDETKWQVVTVDVDGAVGRLQEAARAVLDDGPDSPPAHLPTLRSAGLQLVRVGRGEQLAARADRGRANAADPSFAGRVLDADDLVLGYRIDVRPQDTETWFSLHARRAEYTLDGLPVGDEAVVEEEGHLKPHAVVREAGGLRADEVVARWSGWSLSVPRPAVEGRRAAVGPTPAAEDLVPYRFGFRAEIVDRSLPVLRFGHAYQLRARVVDLAGGGLELDDATAAAEPTGETPYVRYEPVPPPEVVRPDGLLVPDPGRPGAFVVDLRPLGPGGTPERLVVRSEPADDGGFSAAPFAGSPAYPPNGGRALVPPGTTFQLAEQHGVLGGPDAVDLVLRTTATDPRDALPDPIAHGAAVTLLPEPGGLDRVDTEARPWGGAWPDRHAKRIELVPGDVDDEIGLHWDPSPDGVDPTTDPAATAFVTLPPGQRVLVELSSTVLQGDLDTFAISRLAEAPDADTATIRGRHPMITPAHRIELVHAVRRPLSAPAGSLTTRRAPGSTGVVVEPHDAVLGLHTPSTAELTLRAAWQEWDDAPEPVARSGLLAPVAVARGAQTLPELRHELGDTRHRVVTYTATATSRFRDCFAADDAEDMFQVSTTFPPVSLRSSARPAPPVVVSTVPAFAWSNDAAPGGGLVRTRGGGRLRVHLGRPWFTTGEGECVAVIVWPGTEDDVPPEVRPLVSWFNRDPIHPTTAPRALASEADFRGAFGPVAVPLVETGDVVRVLPYPVSWHEGSPFADIEVPGSDPSVYAPFAHLALARFQRESLDRLSLSTVVRTDMVPVLPDRRLEVTADGVAAQVSLHGPGRRGARPNRVTATLERSDAVDGAADLTSLGAGPPAFPAWVRVPGAAVAGALDAPLPPLALPGGPGRFRIVVRETEELGPRGDDVLEAADELAERTVYVDVVGVPLDA